MFAARAVGGSSGQRQAMSPVAVPVGRVSRSTVFEVTLAIDD